MMSRKFMHRTLLIVPIFFLLLQEKVVSQSLPADTNEFICLNKFNLAVSLKLHEKPVGDVMIEIAKSFLGAEYTANSIETPGHERLVVNLLTFDCVTFYENVLALARCVKRNKLSFKDYKNELQYLRYRGGIIDEYPSRLHYTSDYFYDNEMKGVLKDVTKEIGGEPFRKKVNFMSGHSDVYPRLKENEEFIKAIRKIEDSINARMIYYIPKARVKRISQKIKNGDIIGITTDIRGLDCTHTGIAVWKNKNLHMIHAPVPGVKVQITELPLWEYLARIKKDTGIIVARPL
jgi:hypothetical protein